MNEGKTRVKEPMTDMSSRLRIGGLWLSRWTGALVLALVPAACASVTTQDGSASAVSASAIYTDQGWTSSTRSHAYHVSQGSELMPCLL